MKTLPTFLQSSPYLSNPPRSDTQELSDATQSKRSTKFADVVAIIASNNSKKRLSENNTVNQVVHANHESQSNNDGQKNKPLQDREGVIQQQPVVRNVSTAASMKSSSVSPYSSDSIKTHSSPQGMSSVSFTTDRQKRLLTRTILHPDEIDVILSSFKILESSSSGKQVGFSVIESKEMPDTSNQTHKDSRNLCSFDKDEDEWTISSTDLNTWIC